MSEPVQIQIQNADPDALSVREAAEHTRENMKYILMIQRQQAKMKAEYYRALLKEGFSIEHALFLIK